MKTLSIVIAVSLLVVVLMVTDIRMAIATEEFPYPLVSEISISSPSNFTYNTNAVITLNVTANALPGYIRIWMSYSIDGREQVPIPITETYDPHYGTITYANGTTKTAPSMFSRYLIEGYVTLTDLSQGSHNITVYAEYDYPNTKEFDYQTANRLIIADQQTITYLDNSTRYFMIDNEGSSIQRNLDQTGMDVQDFQYADPASTSLSGDLTNPLIQGNDTASAINIGLVIITIVISVSCVAVTLLAFKKSRHK
jgi:hypothetical protein